MAAALIPVMLLTGIFLHDFAALYRARGEAQTAADAAAKAAGMEIVPLFGVGCEPERAARDYAGRNGSELLECSIGGGRGYMWVTVRVARRVELLLLERGDARVKATARCYLDLGPGSPGPLPAD